MTKSFMDDNFLLESATAQKLYHEYAAQQPIIDYHCHLPPVQIAENKQFRNITEIWLGGDHYKWRLMRSSGVTEDYCTGDKSDQEKFRAFCRILPLAIGNPMYHWSHLELRRYFGVDLLINEQNADAIWEQCNAKIGEPALSARGLMTKSNVKAVCTTDDPVDDLGYHSQIRSSNFEVKVLPTFRPDKAANIDKSGFVDYIQKLGQVSGVAISRFDDVIKALDLRMDFFHANGCRLSDHAVDVGFFHASATPAELDAILAKALSGAAITAIEAEQYKTAVLLACGRLDAKRDWVMQLHIGAMRNNNARMFEKLGADTGWDSIGDGQVAEKLSRYLDTLNVDNQLPKTIIYTLNPNHNEVLATMLGNFQDGSCMGKIQLGSGWWFNDQKDGMIRQMTALSLLGNLGAFVGMLTDSRSFLSYTRHEYFRRILCNLLGGWVENGEYPADWQMLRRIVEGICYTNAQNYFKF